MASIIQTGLERVKDNTPFAIATIISHKGSTPRTSGSKMMVQSDKTISGTIGGGLVEAKVIEACLKLIHETEEKKSTAPPFKSQILNFTLDQESKQGMDMVCGGSISVWIQAFIPPYGSSLVTIFDCLADIETKGKTAAIITRITQGTTPEMWILSDQGEVSGSGNLPANIVESANKKLLSDNNPAHFFNNLDEYIIEPLSSPKTLFIFGAGHVGYQLGKMAHLVDFNVEVIDDRKEFANTERFPHATAVHVVKEFSDVIKGLNVTSNTYIAILTRGHLHDQIVLEQALKTNAAYIGMIGSRKKRDQIYANLMKTGIKENQLDRVHSPIGTSIMAETPAEIAVSIIGELIQTRAELKSTAS